LIIQDKILKALDSVRPILQKDGGDVELVEIDNKKVKVKLTGACQGCRSATVTLSRAVLKAIQAEAPEIEELIEILPDGSEKKIESDAGSPWAGQKRIDGVKLIIAVASGKGGVGKSTIAVNLALALKAKGLAVGLLDADIYGPSAPTMLGIKELPPPQSNQIIPAHSHGLSVVSIGFFVAADSPMIWRGPMVMKAIKQFLHDVKWGELDCLIVDMPPGTGDAQLSLAQLVPVDAAIIVTTPSDVALVDARRGLKMFEKVNIRVMGIVENMSYFQCPHCDERTNIFSSGGGQKIADDLNATLLAEIPLDSLIRSSTDSGDPVVSSSVDSPQTQLFTDLADTVWQDITKKIPSWDKFGCHDFMQVPMKVG